MIAITARRIVFVLVTVEDESTSARRNQSGKLILGWSDMNLIKTFIVALISLIKKCYTVEYDSGRQIGDLMCKTLTVKQSNGLAE